MGDLSVNAARAILNRHGHAVRVFVETGTHEGITLWPIFEAGLFEHVHSVELSALYYDRALRRAAGRPGVHLHRGDSAIVLPRLCAGD